MHSENEVVYLYLDDIIPNRFQPRELFDERALKELAVSIKEHGVIQPIIVRKNGEKYEIIAGERRYKASALAGLTKIPAIIRDLDDKESSKVALLENLQRKNLNPVEEAKTYQKILEIDQMTQEELAKTMGKSQSAVANKLRLLGLSENVQNALLNAKISERHARALLSVEDKEEQDRLVKEIIKNRVTVRELERMIKEGKSKEEDIDKEKARDFVNPNDLKNEFEEPSFDMPKKKHKPPMPDTMINFDDVTNELKSKETDKIKIDNDFKPQLIDGLDNKNSDSDNDQGESYKPKFINYGEIDPDLEDNDDESSEKSLEFTSTPNDKFKDLNHINDGFINHDNEPDSGFSKKDSVSSLDSLLNLETPRNNSSESNNSRAESPEEKEDYYDDEDDSDYDDSMDEDDEIVNNTPKEEPKKPMDDFSVSNTFDESLFRTPTIEDFEKKNKASSFRANSFKPSSYKGALRREIDPSLEQEEKKEEPKKTNSNIQYGINSIRDVIKNLEKQDLDIDTEEMDFENSYQIVIKFQKHNEEE